MPMRRWNATALPGGPSEPTEPRARDRRAEGRGHEPRGSKNEGMANRISRCKHRGHAPAKHGDDPPVDRRPREGTARLFLTRPATSGSNS